MIEIKDILTLSDNNKYIVVSKVNYENKNYYYLINENNSDIKFCYEDNNELVELDDKELTTKLIPLFIEVTKQVLFNK